MNTGVLPATREKKALLTLWWCTNGPGWINAEGWEAAALEEVEEELGDSWFGIGLDPAGEDGVTLVDLRRNGLHGEQHAEEHTTPVFTRSHSRGWVKRCGAIALVL